MKIVVLSGAGLSAESGIETFRDKDGLWENHPVDEVATMDGFTANPMLVHKFYNERRRQLQKVKPNAAHYALAELEGCPEVELFHVTQNIDDLCERAGCENVVHMHGELLKCRCLMCAQVVDWHNNTDIDIVNSEFNINLLSTVAAAGGQYSKLLIQYYGPPSLPRANI